MSRPPGDVATSFAAHFFSSGRNLNSLLQPVFLFPTFILGRDLKVMSRPLLLSAKLFFKSRPKSVVATSFVVCDH